MKNFVIINGCPSSIVGLTPTHHYHFSIHKNSPFRFDKFIFLSLPKPISLIPPSSSSSNLKQTKEIDSKLLEVEKFCFEGEIKDYLAQWNVDVLRKFNGFFMELIKQEWFKIVNGGFFLLVVVELLKKFPGFRFSIEDLIKPSDLITTFARKHSPGLPVRKEGESFYRRKVLLSSVGSIALCLLSTSSFSAALAAPSRSDYADMPALRGKDYGKTKMRYPDYTETETGLQFKDLRIGTGPTPKIGDIVVIDWDGYTIGYYGRIFEARNKTKGGSFEGDDKDFFKFKIGSQEVIPAFEEAIKGMSLGGIRRIIVPPELGYPGNDYNQKGPRPTTFSGQRALDFVLRNQGLIDKTLLFDIELLKIIPN